MYMNIKAIIVITIYFSVLPSISCSTVTLENGDIIEIETVYSGNQMSDYDIRAFRGGQPDIRQTRRNEPPFTIKIVDEDSARPYRIHENYNNYNQRPTQWRPPQRQQQIPYQYNQMFRQKPSQVQQVGNSPYVIKKQPSNPNYPEFEIYTLDLKNTGKTQFPINTDNRQYANDYNFFTGNRPYSNNQNQHPTEKNQYFQSSGSNDQYPSVNNHDPITSNQYSNFKNISFNEKEQINDKIHSIADLSNNQNKDDDLHAFTSEEKNVKKNGVDGYINEFPVVLLTENEIRRR